MSALTRIILPRHQRPQWYALRPSWIASPRPHRLTATREVPRRAPGGRSWGRASRRAGSPPPAAEPAGPAHRRRIPRRRSRPWRWPPGHRVLDRVDPDQRLGDHRAEHDEQQDAGGRAEVPDVHRHREQRRAQSPGGACRPVPRAATAQRAGAARAVPATRRRSATGTSTVNVPAGVSSRTAAPAPPPSAVTRPSRSTRPLPGQLGPRPGHRACPGEARGLPCWSCWPPAAAPRARAASDRSPARRWRRPC